MTLRLGTEAAGAIGLRFNLAGVQAVVEELDRFVASMVRDAIAPR
jgi:hypothetical protein